MSSKLRSISLLAVVIAMAACGGQAESVDVQPSNPNETTSPSDVGNEPGNEVVIDDPMGSIGEPGEPMAPPPPSDPMPTVPIGTEEPPVATPPAEEPPANPPPAEEPPATPPPAEEPPAQPPPSTPPPATPPPATPPANPNAGWTPVPQGTRRVYMPKGQIGGVGAGFTVPIAGNRKYRMRYEVMPEGNFDFRAGGKLPGLGGGSTPAGGSTATDGWSGRLMWNQGGRISFYFYRVTGGSGGIDTGGYGTHWMWAADAKLIPGQWNTIEIAVDMNTGETIGYLNGVEKARQSLNYLWNTTDKIVFSTFFGGQGQQYIPVKDEYMSFRNMVIKPGG